MQLSLIYMLVGITGSSLAFPNSEKRAMTGECPFAKARRQSNDLNTTAVFDPVKQKINVNGTYAFQPPKAGDLRGPCPGLNALANHGYLPRNGLVTFDQAIQASNSVFGMGKDIATTLATLGVVVTGNLETDQFSIGGSAGGTVKPPFIALPQGLSGSHNRYETDASPARGDSYIHNGDASSLNLVNFKALYTLQPENGPSNYNLSVLIQHRRYTLDFSIKNNPHFYHGPRTGTLLSNGAHLFIPALFSNHSTEFPDGVLTRDTLKSFFGAAGTRRNLSYKVGYERIPDNWYRRATDYTGEQLGLDLFQTATVVPEAIYVGGNTGKVNTYKLVNISDLTGGAYTYETLLEGNNINCFGNHAVEVGLPDVLKAVYSNVTYAENLVTQKYGSILSSTDCPSVPTYNKTSFRMYPGTKDGGWF